MKNILNLYTFLIFLSLTITQQHERNYFETEGSTNSFGKVLEKLEETKRSQKHQVKDLNSLLKNNLEGVSKKPTHSLSFLSQEELQKEEKYFRDTTNTPLPKKNITLIKKKIRSDLQYFITYLYSISSTQSVLSVYSVLLYSTLQRTYFLDCSHFPTTSYPNIHCYNSTSVPTSQFRWCEQCNTGDYCRVAQDALTFDPTITLSSLYSFCISYFSLLHYDDWVDFDGILGMAYTSDYEMMSGFTDLFPSNWPKIVAIDLNHDSRSVLQLGGYIDSTLSETSTSSPNLSPINKVIWSERQPTSTPTFHQFPIFHFSISCSLYENFQERQENHPFQRNQQQEDTSHHLVRISTSSSCLVLPDEIFNDVMGWIAGVKCSATGSSTYSSYSCQYDHNVFDETQLPVIYFRLSEFGPRFVLPLKSLLISDYKNPLCIRSTSQTGDSEMVFGNLVLENFYVVLDMENYRVGISQKNNITDSSLDGCSQVEKCPSGMTYDWTSNSCEDPVCAEYFFQVVNSETHNCEWSLSFQIFVTFLLVCAGIAEVIVQEYYKITTSTLLRILPNQD